MFTLYIWGILTFGLGLAYLLLIHYFLWHWRQLPPPAPPDAKTIFPAYISVMVPARNEAEAIGDCLDALFQQNYPKTNYEVIVIDDYSTDATPEIVQEYRQPGLRLIKLADQGQEATAGANKKKALEAGIAEAEGILIVTTDADCIAPPDWLAMISAHHREEEQAFIAGPVAFHREKNALSRFQSLDFLGTMLLTGAGIHAGWMHLANGANLAFPKKVFEEVGGYAGIDHLASGDDMLLMHKIAKRYPRRIGFLKSPIALVRTEAKASWRAFIQQRLRWATKSSAYQERQVTAVLALVFFLCRAILLSPLLLFFYGPAAIIIPGILLSFKVWADYRLLREASRFFARPELMRHFWVSQGLHIVYIALIGLWSNLVKEYEWKGRRVR